MNDEEKLILSREWVDFVADRIQEGVSAADLLMAVDVIGHNSKIEAEVLSAGMVNAVSIPDDVAGIFERRTDSKYLTQRFVDLTSMMLMLGDGGPVEVLPKLQSHVELIAEVLPR